MSPPGLLRPAVAVMNRLTYPRKFILISLFFAAPLAVSLYFLLSEFGDRIEFTRKETLGTRYLRPLVGLLRDAGETRRVSRAYAAGERTLRPDLVRLFGRLDEGLDAVEAVDRELGADLKTGRRLAQLRDNVAHLKREATVPEPKDNDALHAAFLTEIRALFAHVGDTSNLILDPDLDTYYLMDAILLKLPEGLSLLMRSAFQGGAAAARPDLSPDERAQLIVLMGLIETNLDEARRGILTAFASNPSGTLAPRLRKPYDDYASAVMDYVAAFRRGILEPRAPALTSAALVAASARPIDVVLDLWQRTVAELDLLMEARIGLYAGRRRIAWTATLILLGLVAYLWLGFYAAVMGTVGTLKEASDRMLTEDPGHELVLQTRDELGLVTESFNAIAQRLRREWKQANDDNARARAAEAGLQESEERTRLILQSALDAVVSIDAGGLITEWNPRAAAIFGWTREEVLGRRLSDLIIPAAYRQQHEEGLRRYAATGVGPVLNQRLELTAQRRNGREFPVELAIVPIRSGKTTVFSAFLRDITDRKRGEEELRGAKDTAEKASQAKSSFLASMSHELRTPLNSVIGFSTVLLKGKGKHLTEQDSIYLERILANGKHLLGLINTILDLSKIEAGKTELQIASVDLGALVLETLGELEGRLVDRTVKLVAQLPHGMSEFGTDRDKLKQVLINLVGNALKFTEKGAVTVRVVVDEKGAPERIEVVDTGLGIPKDSLERIFEAFQQVDVGMARKFEGTGLGLTISRSLCNLLGYRIQVESEPGKGSRFTIVLAPPRGDTSKLAAPAPSAAGDPGLMGKRVLVIDDEADSRVLLSQYVSDCGCRVEEASSGPEALRIARERRPDLITLDLMMPGMNGWEILRDLKSDPQLKDVPVVVVSIVGKENRGTVFGAADLLSKPVSREELCAVLRRNVRPGGRKVLVVDDDPLARRVLTAILGEEGFEAVEAENGEEALKRIGEGAPDLVLLDLMMPVMDGMTFISTVRKDPKHANLPVVVVTAKDLTVQELRHLQERVSAVLKKGEELKAEILGVLRSVLGSLPPSEIRTRIRVSVRPVLADMVPGFLAARREEVGVLRKALEAGDLPALRTAGHNMKGVGTAYGFEPITEIGARMEEAAVAGDRAELGRQIERLADYLDRVDVVTG